MEPVFTSPLALNLSQMFEIDRLSRDIDSLTSIEDAKKIAKDFASLYITEKAVSRWLIEQNTRNNTRVPHTD